jgi:hypothetical protein
MATQIVMDRNGDTRHSFDARDAKTRLKAERRFKASTGLASLQQPVMLLETRS